MSNTDKRPTMRDVLASLTGSIADTDAIARDMLRRPDRRELGPALHRRNYREAHANVVTALDLANKLALEEEEHRLNGKAVKP